MRRGGDLRAHGARFLDDGNGERRALHRVGARAQLVEEDQAAAVGFVQNLNNIGHVR